MISFISSLYLPHAVMDAHDRSDKSFLYHKKEEYPMANVYDKLKEMNLTLPTPPAKGGLYTPVMEFGDHLLYCSGCVLNLLANLDAKLGDLNRIKRFVKVLAFVNSADDFTQQPQVVNGGSQLLLDLYGEERGLPARTAMGVNATPGNISVEIELLAEYE